MGGRSARVVVSDEVANRLQAGLGRRTRLRPDEWRSGEIGWVIDIVGAPAGVRQTLAWLKAGPFKERTAKNFVSSGEGPACVKTLDQVGGLPNTRQEAS